MLVDFIIRNRTGDEHQLHADAILLDSRRFTNVDPRPGDRVFEPEPEFTRFWAIRIVMDAPAAPRAPQYWRSHGDPGLGFVDSQRATAFGFDCGRIQKP
eukprot:184623-Prorocentrum_minimum.AAC.2